MPPRSTCNLASCIVCVPLRAVSVGVGVGAAKQGRERKHARVVALPVFAACASACRPLLCPVVMVTRVAAPLSVVYGVMRILQDMMAGTKPASEKRVPVAASRLEPAGREQ